MAASAPDPAAGLEASSDLPGEAAAVDASVRAPGEQSSSPADASSNAPPTSSWFAPSIDSLQLITGALATLFGLAGIVLGVVALASSRRSTHDVPSLSAPVGGGDSAAVRCVVESEAFRQAVVQIVRAQIEQLQATAKSRVKSSSANSIAAVQTPVSLTPANVAEGPSEASRLVLTGLRQAYAAGVTTSGEEEGFCEFDWNDVESRIERPLSLEHVRGAIREIDALCRSSKDDVLRYGNLVKLRHLRSPSGSPNVRIGVRREALASLFQEFC